jgi:hypothetical protein
MLGRWSADRLTVYRLELVEHTLDVGVNEYAIGPSAAIDTPRPQQIGAADILVAADQRTPLEVIHDAAEWAKVPSHDTPGCPQAVYFDRGGTLYFDRKPDQAYALELYVWQPFSRFATVDDPVAFPPEYEEAIVYQLAVRLAAIAGKEVHPDVRETARTALMDMQSLNAPTPTMSCDPSIVQAGQAYVRFR